MIFIVQVRKRSGCRFNLLMNNGELRELSRESEIVDAISGKRRTDHKLYYPADFLMDDPSKKNIKKQIRSLLAIEAMSIMSIVCLIWGVGDERLC